MIARLPLSATAKERASPVYTSPNRVQRTLLVGPTRAFVAVGVFHCGDGPGLAEFDAFGALVDWVETGRAPETITASRVEGGEEPATRPLCPYPTVATYDGTGDPDRAASFDCT